GIGFDPGGIGKGLAADLVAREMMDLGVKGACVNIGGDVRVAGSSPSGGGWTLAIEHPWCSRPIALVGLQGGAVATSSVLGRTWSVGGNARHHLIDPSTREPSHSDLALASVVAGEAWEAEVYAKAVLLRGSGRAFDLLDDAVQALTVDHSGLVASTGGLQAFIGEAGVASQVAFDIEHTTQTVGDRHE
ncbi:MAG TPA: FAD:protein FMN transferase, partial [Ilumatobacteraceae bacterium]